MRPWIGQRVIKCAAIIVICFAGIPGSCSQRTQTSANADTDWGELSDNYFRPLLLAKRVSAASVTVVKDQRVVFSRTYGPVTPGTTIWRAASVSKAITALAVMQLVEAGKLDLDTDVNHYLKSIRIPATFSQPITLRLLLAHKSGLDDRFVGDGFLSGEQPSQTQLMEKVLPARVYPPGEVEAYSNCGYALIGAIIEQVTGERFESYVATHVLNPLKMTHSSFDQPLPHDVEKNTAPGRWWYQRAAAAGGLATTADDMSAFLMAMLQSSSAVVSPESFRTLIWPPPSAGVAHRMGFWAANEGGHLFAGAAGDSGAFHTLLAISQQRQFGMAILISGGGGNLAPNLYRKVIEAQFGAASSESQTAALHLKAAPGDHDLCARFAGFYRTARYPHHEISKTFVLLDLTRVRLEPDGALRFNNARWIRIQPLMFQNENGQETVSFREDSRGQITFMSDGRERIHFYEVGYVSIAAYFIFLVALGILAWRAHGPSRWLSFTALFHCVAWLAIVLVVGPENLIFGLPTALKAALWLGSVSPLLALMAIVVAAQKRTWLAAIQAAVLFLYVPFVWYWNLYGAI